MDRTHGDHDSAEVEAAWLAVARERLDRALEGEAGLPWEPVKAEAEERLRRSARSAARSGRRPHSL